MSTSTRTASNMSAMQPVVPFSSDSSIVALSTCTALEAVVRINTALESAGPLSQQQQYALRCILQSMIHTPVQTSAGAGYTYTTVGSTTGKPRYTSTPSPRPDAGSAVPINYLLHGIPPSFTQSFYCNGGNEVRSVGVPGDVVAHDKSAEVTESQSDATKEVDVEPKTKKGMPKKVRFAPEIQYQSPPPSPTQHRTSPSPPSSTYDALPVLEKDARPEQARHRHRGDQVNGGLAQKAKSGWGRNNGLGRANTLPNRTRPITDYYYNIRDVKDTVNEDSGIGIDDVEMGDTDSSSKFSLPSPESQASDDCLNDSQDAFLFSQDANRDFGFSEDSIFTQLGTQNTAATELCDSDTTMAPVSRPIKAPRSIKHPEAYSSSEHRQSRHNATRPGSAGSASLASNSSDSVLRKRHRDDVQSELSYCPDWLKRAYKRSKQ